jgi:4-amino-4-deoxy-L-arabinose transferase-like glycosyltransferase
VSERTAGAQEQGGARNAQQTLSRKAIVLALTSTLALYALITVSLSLRTPAWENNDEADHARYTEYVLSHHGLPAISAANGIESHQPPLYYVSLAAWQRVLGIHAFAPSISLPSGPAVAATERINEVSHDYTPQQQRDAVSLHAMRMLSVLFGGVTVAASFAIAWLLFSQLPLAVAVAATVASWPKFDVVAAAVSNEAMTTALVSCSLWTLLLSQRRQTVAWSIASGALAGAAVLTKFTALPIALLMLVCIGFIAASRRNVLPAAGALLAFVAVSGWWFIRNWALYGDPLADAASRAYLAHAVPGLIWPVSQLTPGVLAFGGDTLLRSVWYDGGWNQLQLPLALNVVLSVLAALCLIAAALTVRRRNMQVAQQTALFLLATPIVGSVIAWLLILRETTQAEGRYLLIAVSAWAIVLCAGSQWPVRRPLWLNRLSLALWPALFCAIDAYVFARWEIPFGGT